MLYSKKFQTFGDVFFYLLIIRDENVIVLYGLPDQHTVKRILMIHCFQLVVGAAVMVCQMF